ncbi:hypothetical protein HDZ31DRAFT_72744 [Schizophyllum fasciatum]
MSLATAYPVHISSPMFHRPDYDSTLYSRAYNTFGGDRASQEYYTYTSVGLAEPCLLYMPNHLRLARSRPVQRPRSVLVNGLLDVAHSVLCTAEAKGAVPALETSAPLPATPITPTIPSTPTTPSRAAPTPEEILEGARARKAAEDNALRDFYAKNPALAALRAPPIAQLPTPPSSPGSEPDALPPATKLSAAPRPAATRAHRPANIITRPPTPPCSATAPAVKASNRQFQAPISPPASPTILRSRPHAQTMQPLTQRTPAAAKATSKIPRRRDPSTQKAHLQ